MQILIFGGRWGQILLHVCFVNNAYCTYASEITVNIVIRSKCLFIRFFSFFETEKSPQMIRKTVTSTTALFAGQCLPDVPSALPCEVAVKTLIICTLQIVTSQHLVQTWRPLFFLAELLPYSSVCLLGKRDVDFRWTQQLGNPNVCASKTCALCHHVWQQNSANLRNRVTCCVLRDVLHRTYHGVLDVHRVTLCHGTDVNVACPSLRRLSWNL